MTTATHPTLAQYQTWFPVRQLTRTGKFGWRRCNGALDMSACRFATEAEAAADRDENYAEFCREPFSR